MTSTVEGAFQKTVGVILSLIKISIIHKKKHPVTYTVTVTSYKTDMLVFF